MKLWQIYYRGQPFLEPMPLEEIVPVYESLSWHVLFLDLRMVRW